MRQMVSGSKHVSSSLLGHCLLKGLDEEVAGVQILHDCTKQTLGTALLLFSKSLSSSF